MAAKDNTTRNLLIAGGSLAALALILRPKPAKAKKPQPKPEPEGCDYGPFAMLSPTEMETAINDAIDAGMRSTPATAEFIAVELYPEQEWPPGATELEARCYWDDLIEIVEEYVQGLDIPPWPPCPVGETLKGDRCIPGIDLQPWENPMGVPEHGTFYQVKFGDILLGENPSKSIIWNVLRNAAYEAATEIGGMPEGDAQQYAEEVADNNSLRVDYIDLIQCGQFNDALYQTYGYGPPAWPGPNGRALRLMPYHYNNRKRMLDGLAPERNIELMTPADKGEGNGGKLGNHSSFAYLWLPRINLERLWNDGDITSLGPDAEWEDGVPGYEPPPEVRAFGLPEPPQGVTWGCG